MEKFVIGFVVFALFTNLVVRPKLIKMFKDRPELKDAAIKKGVGFLGRLFK